MTLRTRETTVEALEFERARLEQELEEARREQQLTAERHAAAVEQNTMLTSLFVACSRLHACTRRDQVLLAVREIVANLVGCEEYILYRLEDNGLLFLEDSSGLDTDTRQMLLPGSGNIGQTAITGETFIAEDSQGRQACAPGHPEAGLTACIPLMRNGLVIGVLALFRLLPQKNGLNEWDRDLFGLLQTHVATALYCTGPADAAWQEGGAA